ncbi:MAG: serine hydrolase domain-containing protein [Bacteroidota bacterium]
MKIRRKIWDPRRLFSLFTIIFMFTVLENGCAQKPGNIKELKEEIINLSKEYLELNKYASGVITRISYPDSLDLIYTSGYRDNKDLNALNGEELFIAASITKTFMAVCILQQMEENLLSLDDKVVKYVDKETLRKLTRFKNRSYGNEITIEHLLRHTSGIVDYLNKGEVHLSGLNNNPNRNYSLQERLDFALELGENTATNKPGKYYYSNTNYILLGIIAEKVDKKDISKIFENRIIKPLELSNTSLNPSNTAINEMFNGYYENRDLTKFTLEFNRNNPAAGILTNVDDLIAFGKAVFQGALFANDRTFVMMLDFNDGYGLGVMQFEKSRKTGRVIGHSGYDPGYTSYLIYLEDIDTCIVTVINQSELKVEMPAFLVVKIVAAFKDFL